MDTMMLQQPLWSGPYHPSWPPEPDSWVIWVMPHFVKVGQLVEVNGISAKIWFQGHESLTVIPDAYSYWHPTPPTPMPLHTLAPTEPPRHRVESAQGPEMTVRQAAALLGTSTKEVRRMLRSGALEGRQEQGSWVAVVAASVNARRGVASPATAS